MDYYLNRINVLLIALVGGLCVYQWAGEKNADTQILELRRVARVAQDRAASQAEALRGTHEDLDELKKVIGELKTASDSADVQIRQQKARIFVLESGEKRRAADADDLKRALAAYKEAVAGRDKDIRILLGQRQQLIDSGKETVAKATEAYNGLVAKYSELIGHYNDLAARYKALTAPPPGQKQTLLWSRLDDAKQSLCLSSTGRRPATSDSLYQ
jgi:chromosome segregation ATPase